MALILSNFKTRLRAAAGISANDSAGQAAIDAMAAEIDAYIRSALVVIDAAPAPGGHVVTMAGAYPVVGTATIT